MNFAVRTIVRDATRNRVGRITAVNGDCLALTAPGHAPWDALASWCEPATSAERRELQGKEQDAPAA
ncbi:hypothetical protein ACFVFQ_31655 [Streptomyces sp. NPDC057743]|uniref:hypothetical protein n=1 Tax=Streptomyces sp. NPDC057743 TaxID=3346236 RepID=UPI0036992055